MVAVTAKSRTITNGTANDGSVVEAIQTELYNNDQTLANAVTNLQSGGMTIAGAKTFSSSAIFSTGLNTDTISENTAATGVTIDGLLIKDASAPAIVFQPGYKTSRYYVGPTTWIGNSTAVAGRGINGTNTVVVPFYVSRTQTFDRIAIQVTTAIGASTIHLGIYNAGSDGFPGARLLDAGTVSGASPGNIEAVISQILTAGWYWLSVRASNAGLSLAYSDTPGTVGNLWGYLHGNDNFGAGIAAAFYDSADTPVIFTSTPSQTFSPNIPLIALRAA